METGFATPFRCHKTNEDDFATLSNGRNKTQLTLVLLPQLCEPNARLCTFSVHRDEVEQLHLLSLYNAILEENLVLIHPVGPVSPKRTDVVNVYRLGIRYYNMTLSKYRLLNTNAAMCVLNLLQKQPPAICVASNELRWRSSL
ncbi:hypothetical protein ANN_27365 [Periplaneta americana]|uniref:Uncharacterized protein n=1 Tax=Periplaneta americana TaxID=6978 RepID=A0ABQ8RXU3_PERAM|nr:hypothetical protein ANN_27365 [Periplaneta americana]